MSSPYVSLPGSISRREWCYNPAPSASFKDMLDGATAFYNHIDYLKITQEDFAQNKPLPVNYTWNTEHTIIRIAKHILSIIIFPIGIYQLLHALVGKVALLPASTPRLLRYPENYANDCRLYTTLDGQWKYKRITIEVDGYKIDATIMGKASTLNNGRWLLASNGNGGFYEEKLLLSRDFKQILSEIDGNAIVFNYPGVGSSSGLPNKQAMTKAYRAILNLLEDQRNGIGAKEIIGYGHSLGGGVQGESLKTHKLKKGVKYLFIKDRTFSNVRDIVSIKTNKPLGFLVKMLGWNMDSVESSKKLQAPEIILQTADVQEHEELNDSSRIKCDGIIPPDGSLAKVLLDDRNCPKQNKVFIGIPEGHAEEFNPSFLAKKIKASLLQI